MKPCCVCGKDISGRPTKSIYCVECAAKKRNESNSNRGKALAKMAESKLKTITDRYGKVRICLVCGQPVRHNCSDARICYNCRVYTLNTFLIQGRECPV